MFANVPIGIVAIALAPVLLSESRELKANERIDLFSVIAVTFGLVALIYGLVQAPEAGWGRQADCT